MRDILKKIEQAKHSTDAMNELVAEYLPFIKQEAARQPNLGIEYDDRVSLGMAAFMRSVEGYDAGRGNFVSYAAASIRNTLIDEAKRQNRHAQNTVPLEQESGDEKTISLQHRAAAREYQRQEQGRALAEEIDLLESELKRFGMTLDVLDKISPRHKRATAECIRAGRLLAMDGEKFRNMIKTRQIPVRKLAEASGVSPKTIGKFRKYIIAVSLIVWNNLTGIERFLPGEEKAGPQRAATAEQ